MSIGDGPAAAARKAADTFDDLKARTGEEAERAKDAALSLKDALDDCIRTRPYTTLIAAGALGFLYAVLRRR